MKRKVQLKIAYLLFFFIFLGFTYKNAKADSLYVKIVSFSVEYVPAGKSVNIHWVTEGDKDSVQYIIERSLDSSTFRMIGHAKNSEGSKGKNDYYFYDTHPIGGISYYRIREIIDTGRQFVTPVQKVKTPISKMALVQLFLSENMQDLSFAVVSPHSAKTRIYVSNLQGDIKAFYKLQLKRGANTKSIFVGNLNPGVYFLQVNNQESDESVMEKFIIHAVSDKKEK